MSMDYNINKGVTIKNNNTEINLIDLLDNVYVSHTENVKEKQIEDYQIKMLEEFCSTSKLSKQNKIDDEQFALFFDKYEKTIQDTTKHNNADLNVLIQNNEHIKGLSTPNTSFKYNYASEKNEGSTSCSTYESSNKSGVEQKFVNACAFNLGNNYSTPRILVPKLKFDNEPDERNNEDLIEEVLFEQQLEKQIYKAKDIKIERPSKMPDIKQESHKREDLNSDSNILDEIINKNKVKLFNTQAQIKHINMKGKDMISEPCLNNKVTSEKIKLQQKVLTEELVTKYDLKYLETVKKIDKTFRSSALKSDAEKINLTAGPSLYEKSIVLPQIMQRLKERQKVLEERSRLTMRLILDGGTEKSNVKNHKSLDVELSKPHFLMTDCNKERMRAYESAKLFNSYVRLGSVQK